GESTQHKGIIPDIEFPTDYDPSSIGESTLDSPLPWDKIPATRYRPKDSVSQVKKELNELHATRADTDPEFIYLRDAAAYRQVRSNQKFISLNEAKRRQEEKDSDEFWLSLENQKRARQNLPAIASLDELNPKKEEPTLASAAGQTGASTGAAGQGTTENSGAGEGDPLQGNELAGVTELPAVTPDEDTAEKTAASEPEAPDAQLIETGHILIDLMSLQKQTAEEKSQRQS
ncbi:MAG: carboxy terminal-processing peptidase, partial [Pseudomonadales bacterium]|nr:carboxy terminal-processing peptidase [Pseudomonadales bacterium]